MSKVLGKIRETQKSAFLKLFREIGVLAWCADAAGVARATVYEWKKADPEFLAAFTEAEEIAADKLEVEAIRRAHDGVERYVVNQGRIVNAPDGTPLVEREYSDQLLIRLLMARRRDKFGNHQSLEHATKDDKPLVSVVLPHNFRDPLPG
ncbi:MAG TPA: hypothetical protein VMH92_05655 [Acidocella sp.]|nr:hypothetical protein [Acidocella sp.]